MKNLFKTELHRMFRSKTMYISILIGIALCVWLLAIELIEVSRFEKIIEIYGTEKAGLYYPRSLFNSFIGLEYAYLPSSILYTIFPVLVTFPYSVSFYTDKKSGYLKNILLRCDRKKYYIGKYITAFISGALITFSILGFSLLISALFFPALPPELSTYTFSPQRETQMWLGLFLSHPMIYTVLYIFIDMVFYGLIATVPLTIGMFAKNTFTVMSVPMLIYIIVHYVFNTIGLNQLSPMNFLRPCQIFTDVNFIIILLEALCLLAVTLFTFVIFGGKRDVY